MIQPVVPSTVQTAAYKYLQRLAVFGFSRVSNSGSTGEVRVIPYFQISLICLRTMGPLRPLSNIFMSLWYLRCFVPSIDPSILYTLFPSQNSPPSMKSLSLGSRGFSGSWKPSFTSLSCTHAPYLSHLTFWRRANLNK